MTLLKRIAAAAAIGFTAAAGASSPAAPFPGRGQTLRIVVPFAAGGGVDNAARLLGEQLRKQLGVTVVVENKAGASGTIGGKAVQTAQADGTTLLFSAATHVLARQVLTNPPYDPQADFAPVARFGEAPLMVVVGPQAPQQKLADVLAAARKQPEAWTAAIPAAGAPSHLATVLLAQQGGVKFTYVAYKGTQPALTDVGGGHVNLLVDSMISVLPLAKAGRVRALAITSKKRSQLAPDVPTAQEAGVPLGAPPDRVAALNTAINAATAELSKSGALAALGIDAVAETPEQFRRFIAADVAQGAELLKSAGFKPE
jgi:tripartite-type tricarboxylate transporter receptor subunit TctC